VKTRAAIISMTALIGLAALAGPVGAAPPGAGLDTLPVTCEGQDVTVTVTGGNASFWLGDQRYVLLSIDAVGTWHAAQPLSALLHPVVELAAWRPGSCLDFDRWIDLPAVVRVLLLRFQGRHY
jgi:hypothetical protein